MGERSFRTDDSGLEYSEAVFAFEYDLPVIGVMSLRSECSLDSSHRLMKSRLNSKSSIAVIAFYTSSLIRGYFDSFEY